MAVQSSEISVFNVGIAKLRNYLTFAVLSSEMMYILGSAKLRDDLSLCHKHSVFVGTSKLRNNLFLGQF